MGIRCTQWIGLNDRARQWLSENANWVVVGVVTCPDCGVVVLKGREQMEIVYENRTTSGMFDEQLELTTWRHKDGTLIREIVQAKPWSSGPCIFTCLELEDTTRIGEWTDAEIEQGM